MVTAGIFPFKENSHGRGGNRNVDVLILNGRFIFVDVALTGVYKLQMRCNNQHLSKVVRSEGLG